MMSESAMTPQDCVSILKGILQEPKTEKSSKNIPNGAQPTFWMFTLPECPKDDYNEVYPNIFIGNGRIAKDKSVLQELKVTHVLNAAQGSKANQIPTDADYYTDVGIQFLGIPAKDISGYQLSQHFEETTSFIEQALNSGGRVYVHCMQGVSRSATLVMAYLMMKKERTVIQAVKEVRAHRAVFPNHGFLLQLSILNEQLYGLVQA